mmetsp:Transcript_33289/g.84056  ORF Transcript_33289/g.84056 Transcript_33289/m.84056 type:complete len:131 (+) Transcript_33289:165-557(+)
MRVSLPCKAADEKRLMVGKDVDGKAGDRVVLSEEGRQWCQSHFPEWYSDCPGTITRVDKDGKMCDVKWDDRDRPYHYHTGCFTLFHLVVVPDTKPQKCPYVRPLKRKVSFKVRHDKSRKPRNNPRLLLMR